ncbi:type I-G CRISPR-associated protein Csb2 [Mycolicibacterium thermoresistibile]
MARFAIVATFPLGTYTGHRRDGSPDPFPDLARLHAALVNAAAQGSTAVLDRTGLRPTERAVNALKWIEQNPPSGIRLPRTVQLSNAGAIAYRAEGVIRKEGGRWVDKKVTRPICDGVALDGPFGWCWDTEVPTDVEETLAELCADVSCLGEAASPVVLHVGEIEPTDVLKTAATAFEAGGRRVRAPAPGRVDWLLQAHQGARPAKYPTLAQDRHKASEEARPSPVASDGLTELRYIRPEPQPPAAPWQRVVLLEVNAPVPREQRVGWCVALHRAIISRIGLGAPPLITGKYGRGVLPPANRLAIQYLDQSMVAVHGAQTPAFALLIPRDADSEDLLTLHRAVAGLTYLKSRYGERRVKFNGLGIDAHEFWPAPRTGYRRLWMTHPVAIPETRPQRDDKNRLDWTLADAALLSLGFVWRDGLGAVGSGSAKYRDVVATVKQRGTEVLSARLVTTGDSAKYVHKLPDGVIAQPYRATLDLGSLSSARTLVAVGQTRHLGGGLLVPVDVPADAADLLEEAARWS